MAFKCSECGKEFTFVYTLNNHMRVHIGEKSIKCDKCEETFKLKSELRKHYADHHKPYKCMVCGKEFSLDKLLQVHMYIHTGEKIYTCKLCDKAFVRSDNLQEHLRLHDKVKYKCEICGRGFDRPSGLRRHMNVHTKGRAESCEKCGKLFADAYTLAIHTKNVGCQVQMRTHTGEKPLKCPICQKVFMGLDELKKHMRSHTRCMKKGISYKCSVCARGFRTNWQLRRHKSIHTDKQRRTCRKCNKLFPNTNALKVHTVSCRADLNMKKCSMCSVELRSDANLEMHMQTHMIEKPFKCKVCAKAFTWSDELKEHKSSHNNRKPSRMCDICKKVFLSSASLMTHMYFHFGRKSSLKPKLKSQKSKLKSCLMSHNGVGNSPTRLNEQRNSSVGSLVSVSDNTEASEEDRKYHIETIYIITDDKTSIEEKVVKEEIRMDDDFIKEEIEVPEA